MNEIIKVEMTREQARAVMDATELLARLEIGQFKEICWKMIDHFITDDNKFDGKRRDMCDVYLEQAAREMFGMENGYLKLGEKSLLHERCWAVYTTIRHAMAWHDHPEGNPWSVMFDKPMPYGEPMPTCKVVDVK